MRYLAALATMASFLAACSPPREAEATAVAPVSADAPATRAYEMPDSEVLTIASPVLGRTYEVFVRLPPGHGDAGAIRYCT